MITFTEMKKLLLESCFNPKTKGHPMAIIMEQGDARFFETRAIEFIREAQQAIMFPNPNSQQLEIYNDKIAKAISLLAIARGIRSTKPEPKRSRDENNQ